MGNSRFHAFLYPLLLSHPGIVTLHDLRLTNFHEQFGERAEVERGHLIRELTHDWPEEAGSLLREWDSMRRERGGIPVALSKRGVDLNRRVFERSNRVILHSNWSSARARRIVPACASKLEQIPFGAIPEQLTEDRRCDARRRLDLPLDSIVLASLGFLGWGKMNEEAIMAFAEATRDNPKARLVFAGKDLDDGCAQRTAERLSIQDRVIFLKGTTDANLCELARAADIGVNLRREPTSGETSGTLFTFLRMGVPTIVTDLDSFQDEPDDVVFRIRWNELGMPELVRAMQMLINDRELRTSIGHAALQHVVANHTWPAVASRYAGIIESAGRKRPARSIHHNGGFDETNHQMAS
jgi:glycosyltransferase involved in cell wall biosynthesis